MTRVLPPLRRHPRPGCRRAGAQGEDGFILMESLVAIGLIGIILAALGGFTLQTVTQTNELRARQAATQVATSAMTVVDSIPASDLLTKRDMTSAHTQYASGVGISTVAPYLDSLAEADNGSTVVTGAAATLSTSPQTVTLNNVAYQVNTYVGSCVMVDKTSSCVKSGAAGVTYYRVVVWVTWTSGGCASSAGCAFATSTLVNHDDDPVFNTNKATPPATPIVAPPGDQTSTITGPVSLTLTTKPGTGVNPMTWAITAGALPLGLTLGANGVISGTPSATQPSTSVTVTVTDAFGRTGSASFNWTVLAAPTITTPPAQSSRVGSTTSLSIGSTCPNSACRFAVTGAPAGLSINASTGVISGTPTTTGANSVVVTITDAANVSASTAAFTWTITAPGPTVTSPGNQNLTVGTSVNVPIPYTCPNPTCTITLSNGIPGLVLTNPAASSPPTTPETAAKFTSPGTVDTTGTTNLSVGKTTTQSSTAFSGSPSRAVDGNTDGVFNNGSVSHTDSEAQPWWQVDLGSASLVRAVRIWNRTDCCDTRLTNFYVFTSQSTMTGKTAAQLLADPAVTVQRVSGLNGQPSITVPAQSAARYVRVQLSGLTGATYLHMAEVQVLGSADPGTSVTVSSPSGTVYVTGTVPASAVPSGTSKAYAPSLSITDLSGASSTSAAGTWTAFTAPTIGTLANNSVSVQQTVNVPLAYTCPIARCTLTLPATVPGLGLSTTGGETTANNTATVTVTDTSGTVYYSGKVANSALPSGTTASYVPQITITDTNAIAASTTGSWTVTQALKVAVPDQSIPRPGFLSGTKTYTVDASTYVTPRPGSYTYALSNGPSWLTINPTTGVMTASINFFDASDSAITITVTSTSNPSVTASNTFAWTIQ